MAHFETLIKKRRSIRKFTAQPLLPADVERILKAGLLAPTSKSSMSWQFVVVEDKEVLKQLAGCKPHGAAYLKGASLAVVVLGDTTRSDVWVEDASVASIYMQLQAEDLNIGSCWCQVRNRFTATDTDAEQYIRDLLQIPYYYGVLSVIGFGYKEQDRQPINDADLLWEQVHVGTFRLPLHEPGDTPA